MSHSKFQPSKNFSPTTFGKDSVHIAFADICNKCEKKSDYKKYVNNIHRFRKLIHSISTTKFDKDVGLILLKTFTVNEHNNTIVSHYNNIIKIIYNENLINK